MHTHLVSGESLVALALAVRASGGVFNDAGADRLEALRDEVGELTAASEAILAKADEEERDLEDDELSTIGENTERIENLTKQIKAREAAGIGRQPAGRKTRPEPTNGPGNPGTAPARPRGADHGRSGFQSFGEFAINVRNAALPDHQVDTRLQAIATTSGNEGTGADGGFLVPPDFREEIWKKVMGEENLTERTEQFVTSKNNYVFPKDETTPWDTTTGVQAAWEAELAQMDQSKPAFEQDQIRLTKLTGLVPISEELLEDAPGIESWLRVKMPEKMRSKINTAIVRGTGVGQPLGIINAPSLITVAAETSQAADTILYANIINMWNRLWGPLRRDAVWLINQDIEPQLDVMEFSPGSSTPVPVYLPNGGASGSPFATLKGRPVIPVEPCSTLGDVGDIILTNLRQYMTITKGRDIQTDVSMHLYFHQAALAFRFILRMNGKPLWGSAIDPQFGTTTRSWAVTLAERA